MDKKIQSIRQTTKELEKKETSLLAADKKRDKQCDLGARMMAKKKKK
jgi:hypothetical protein